MPLDKAQFTTPPIGNPLGFIGSVFAGDGVTIENNGKISVAPPTATQIGGVKAGSNITIDPDGTISASGGGGGGVSRLIAGSNITLNPTTGVGDVTISATGGGGGGSVDSVTGGTGINVSPTTGSVVVNNTGVTRITPGRGLGSTGNTGDIGIYFTENTVVNFDPLVWNSGSDWNPGGPSGGQSSGLGSFNFTVPDGCNGAAIWFRGQAVVIGTSDPAEWPGGSPSVMNVRSFEFKLSGGGGLNITTGGSLVGQYLCMISKNGRGIWTTPVRFDLANISGSGSRNVSISVEGRINDGIGQNAARIAFPQLIVLPFQK